MVSGYVELISLVRPRILMMENVRGITSMKHRDGGTYSDCRPYLRDRLVAFRETFIVRDLKLLFLFRGAPERSGSASYAEGMKRW